ncbi:hypothetical protein MLD38_024483 [Melastoma candidum]|uniref:Uncharacterized protein n=1 Tax=Melastoma candidum TaxID=119954 RepID=A0ACB9NSI3_9MYRT|nr:hypothetical protein MLD38_024483 [Melastoma candidum]
MSSDRRHCLLLLSLIVVSLTAVHGRLSLDYYSKTCPDFPNILLSTVTSKQLSTPTTAAALLRLFLHDCLPGSCDSSVLLSPERSSDINLSLPGDAFDLIFRLKSSLEISCPSVVSCSDIIVASAHHLLVILGGPHFPLYLGRKDSFSPFPISPDTLPLPDMTVSEVIALFGKRGFSVREMVALSGAHTVGFSHCSSLAKDIYNFSSSAATDPRYNARFAEGLRSACRNYKKDPTLAVFNDIMTPGKFDNEYFKNLERGLGVLGTDRGMAGDERTKGFVEMYAKDQDLWFKDFGNAMLKVSLMGIKAGRAGEIRRRCDVSN